MTQRQQEAQETWTRWMGLCREKRWAVASVEFYFSGSTLRTAEQWRWGKGRSAFIRVRSKSNDGKWILVSRSGMY